jgi:hypothetical protein
MGGADAILHRQLGKNLRKSAQSVDKKDVIHRLHFSQITEPPIESLAEREQ